jgi:hypothetical protein
MEDPRSLLGWMTLGIEWAIKLIYPETLAAQNQLLIRTINSL